MQASAVEPAVSDDMVPSYFAEHLTSTFDFTQQRSQVKVPGDLHNSCQAELQASVDSSIAWRPPYDGFTPECYEQLPYDSNTSTVSCLSAQQQHVAGLSAKPLDSTFMQDQICMDPCDLQVGLIGGLPTSQQPMQHHHSQLTSSLQLLQNLQTHHAPDSQGLEAIAMTQGLNSGHFLSQPMHQSWSACQASNPQHGDQTEYALSPHPSQRSITTAAAASQQSLHSATEHQSFPTQGGFIQEHNLDRQQPCMVGKTAPIITALPQHAPAVAAAHQVGMISIPAAAAAANVLTGASSKGPTPEIAPASVLHDSSLAHPKKSAHHRVGSLPVQSAKTALQGWKRARRGEKVTPVVRWQCVWNTLLKVASDLQMSIPLLHRACRGLT